VSTVALVGRPEGDDALEAGLRRGRGGRESGQGQGTRRQGGMECPGHAVLLGRMNVEGRPERRPNRKIVNFVRGPRVASGRKDEAGMCWRAIWPAGPGPPRAGIVE